MNEERINRLLTEGLTIDQIDEVAYCEAEKAWADAMETAGHEAEEVRL